MWRGGGNFVAEHLLSGCLISFKRLLNAQWATQSCQTIQEHAKEGGREINVSSAPWGLTVSWPGAHTALSARPSSTQRQRQGPGRKEPVSGYRGYRDHAFISFERDTVETTGGRGGERSQQQPFAALQWTSSHGHSTHRQTHTHTHTHIYDHLKHCRLVIKLLHLLFYEGCCENHTGNRQLLHCQEGGQQCLLFKLMLQATFLSVYIWLTYHIFNDKSIQCEKCCQFICEKFLITTPPCMCTYQ